MNNQQVNQKLVQATEENWEEVYKTFDDGMLRYVSETRPEVFGSLHYIRTLTEIERRNKVNRAAEMLRAEKHAEKLTRWQLRWGIVGGLIGSGIIEVIKYYFNPIK